MDDKKDRKPSPLLAMYAKEINYYIKYLSLKFIVSLGTYIFVRIRTCTYCTCTCTYCTCTCTCM